jgi:sodium-coupled neutral amino acid transporter 2
MVMPTMASAGEDAEARRPLLTRKRDDEQGDDASFAGAVFNLSTTIVGAGIMALPATMNVLGLVPGLTLVVLAAVLTDSSIELLMRFSNAVGAASYGEAMGDAFGVLGRGFLQLCVVVNNVGVMVVYMIIIGIPPPSSLLVLHLSNSKCLI